MAAVELANGIASPHKVDIQTVSNHIDNAIDHICQYHSTSVDVHKTTKRDLFLRDVNRCILQRNLILAKNKKIKLLETKYPLGLIIMSADAVCCSKCKKIHPVTKFTFAHAPIKCNKCSGVCFTKHPPSTSIDDLANKKNGIKMLFTKLFYAATAQSTH